MQKAFGSCLAVTVCVASEGWIDWQMMYLGAHLGRQRLASRFFYPRLTAGGGRISHVKARFPAFFVVGLWDGDGSISIIVALDEEFEREVIGVAQRHPEPARSIDRMRVQYVRSAKLFSKRRVQHLFALSRAVLKAISPICCAVYLAINLWARGPPHDATITVCVQR